MTISPKSTYRGNSVVLIRQLGKGGDLEIKMADEILRLNIIK